MSALPIILRKCANGIGILSFHLTPIQSSSFIRLMCPVYFIYVKIEHLNQFSCQVFKRNIDKSSYQHSSIFINMLFLQHFKNFEKYSNHLQPFVPSTNLQNNLFFHILFGLGLVVLWNFDTKMGNSKQHTN